MTCFKGDPHRLINDTTIECANLDCFDRVELAEAISVLENSWVCSSECLWDWNNQGFVRSEFYD